MSFIKFLTLFLQIFQILGFAFCNYFLWKWHKKSAKKDIVRSLGWAINTSCFSFVLAIILAIDGTNTELILAAIIEIMVLPSIVVALLKEK